MKRYLFSEEINLVPKRGDNPGKLLHKGNMLADYLEGQKKSGLKVGDRVKVLRKAKDYEAGWRRTWGLEPTTLKDKTIGKTGVIVSKDGMGIAVEMPDSDGDTWIYPYFILKKVG